MCRVPVSVCDTLALAVLDAAAGVELGVHPRQDLRLLASRRNQYIPPSIASILDSQLLLNVRGELASRILRAPCRILESVRHVKRTVISVTTIVAIHLFHCNWIDDGHSGKRGIVEALSFLLQAGWV